MKVVMIKNQIINCEEIRNIYIAPGKTVRILFKNCDTKNTDSYTSIRYKTNIEAEEIIHLIYSEMISQ